MSIEIKYDGNTVANLSAGQTATFHCDGKKMDGDISVIAPWSMSGGGGEDNVGGGGIVLRDIENLTIALSKVLAIGNIADDTVNISANEISNLTITKGE